MLVGICTHLGCSPQLKPADAQAELGADWLGGFFCPCHGSKFDLAGRVFKGEPAPTTSRCRRTSSLSDTHAGDRRRHKKSKGAVRQWRSRLQALVGLVRRALSVGDGAVEAATPREYYAPKNFNFWYFFGSLALLVLVIQIVTGIFLTMNYKPDASHAFDSVEYIMRDVPWRLADPLHALDRRLGVLHRRLPAHVPRRCSTARYRKPRELVWIFGC